MTLIVNPQMQQQLIADFALAGAPGFTMQLPGGPGNVVHELIKGVVTGCAPLINASALSGFWILSLPPFPTTTPVPVVPGTWLIPPLSLAPQPALRAQAQIHATSLGWTGALRSVLFDGMHAGLKNGLVLSGKLLSTDPASQSAVVAAAPGIYQWQPGPLAAPALAAAMQTQWNANPLLLGSDPLPRVPVARKLAESIVDVYSQVRPAVSSGTPGSPTPPIAAPLPTVIV